MWYHNAKICCWLLPAGFSALFMGCDAIPSKGLITNANTGMVTQWTVMAPEEVILVMNGEELGHTDIPLGESFELVAKNVQNLIARDGKISVGCALAISDTSGRLLLNEADLFAGQPEIPASKDQFLRCTINTGAPMEWDEHYKVTVRFWNKYGKGEIRSTVEIRMIDIP